MVLTIAAFEVRQRLRRISTYIYFLVFLTLSIFFVCMAGGAVSGASVDFGTGGKIWLNSPYALNVITMYVTFLGIVVTGAIAGQATYQDIDSHIKDLFYTAPITKVRLFGRKVPWRSGDSDPDFLERRHRSLHWHAPAVA